MNLLNNMKIGRRLAVAVGAVVLMLIAGTAMAIYSVSTVYADVQKMQVEAEKQMRVRDVESSIDSIITNVANYLVAVDAADRRGHLATIDEERSAYKADTEWLKANATTTEGQKLLAALETAMTKQREADNNVIELVDAGNAPEAANVYNNDVMAARDDVEKVVLDLIAWRSTRMSEVSTNAERTITRNNTILTISIVVAALLAALLGFLMVQSITKPLHEAMGYVEHLSRGDFSFTIDPALVVRKDEMGDIGRSLQRLLDNLKNSLGQVRDGMTTLSSSSNELSTVSMEMAASASEASSKARVVAAAAEEMSTSTISVAAGMEQATMNLRSVATSTEEMTATIGEIANNSEKARRITSQAVAQAERISAAVRELGRAAQEIGKVTETITSISNQTHLLALNATIEAARAGAAGKGFAVVATEIKELAQQTAGATEDIKNKVSGVQSSTGSAVIDIEKISEIIREVSDIVTTIATAIEEQSVVTRDIAANISQATVGVKDANERVAQTATVAQTVARDIVGVSNVGAEIDQGSGQVQTSAMDLSNLADQLTTMVDKFKLN
jgi:methyl-accepting chemotaxis protein